MAMLRAGREEKVSICVGLAMRGGHGQGESLTVALMRSLSSRNFGSERLSD
jgi:hypothetical protein